MRDDLLFHYERELTYLRYLSADFARKYPKVAGRLLLENSGKTEDPHVGRLMEAFAFLAARIHTKIDDEFPAVIESLFSILYPHYLRPMPSATIVQFALDPEQGKVTSGHTIPAGALLYSAAVSGVPCKFQTSQETTLWPLDVKAADWRSPDRMQPPMIVPGAVAVIRLELNCFADVTFSKLKLKTLRFYLQGEGTNVHSLIELLCNSCIQVVARDLAAPHKKAVTLAPSAVRQGGLTQKESLVPFPRRSFWGYRLLQEYFTFPEKFCFIDVSDLDKLSVAGFGNRIELLFYLSEFERSDRRQMLELAVSKDTFRLGCAPAVNLFEQVAEPILVEQKRFEYRIVPDARREQSFDIYSVESVVGIRSGAKETTPYAPFYAHRHTPGAQGEQTAFWHISRRPAAWRKNKGSEVFIHFVDLSGEQVTPDNDSITVRLLCTNGELPSRLPFGNENGDFQLEMGGPVTRVVALTKPTDTLLPPSEKGLLWRLISQLSLNYLSLIAEGRDAFQEILRLHNFGESISVEKQIEGITDLKTSPHFGRLLSEHGITFARGTRVELELDEEKYAGTGAYTFGAVLEVFLGLYASMNSFTQLQVRTRQRKRVLKQWAPRSGQRILV